MLRNLGSLFYDKKRSLQNNEVYFESNMNIGIVTFYYKNYNFGGALQARALTKAVNSIKGVKAEQIQIDFRQSWKKESKLKHLLATIEHHGLHESIRMVRNFKKREEHKRSVVSIDESLLRKRMQAFDKFSDETAHSKGVYSDSNFRKCTEEYQAFICGGDQIWNDWGTEFYSHGLNIYTLKSIPNNCLKLSYAPSIPMKSPNRAFLKKLKEGLLTLNAVSVRENSSVQLIENLIGKTVNAVVDPVLLLTSEQWDEQCVLPDIREKYIICYLLGEGRASREAAQEYAKGLGVKLLVFPFIGGLITDDCDFGDIRDFTSGPAEFVGLIRNAEAIITDSFHATVFSVIYHKPFYVVERTTLVGGNSMESRLIDFLDEYKLSNQRIEATRLKYMSEIPRIDYNKVDEILRQRRMESYEYLKTNLKSINQ